jgi:hypothetical protein
MVAGNDACVTAGVPADLRPGTASRPSNRSVTMSFGYADGMGAPA